MNEILLYAVAGFIAQLIDGVLGMGYGVSATSFLLSLGVPPAVSSASVHTAETVATGFSAYSHYRYGNVIWSLAKRLLIPGVIGAVIGAYILTQIPGETIRPFIAVYLLLMGALILLKAFRPRPTTESHAHLGPLGLAGGFFDAIGGGGWGPIVVGTLLARGNEPRTTIGSVNFAEFFVTLAASLTFFLTMGLAAWKPIAGLALGGALAAPIAAKLVGRIPARPLMIGVGVFVIVLSLRTLLAS
ncbi:MAG TPA: sulfite exporter TauE/SafE family protein [Thermoanaerobaculia bacterium]|nr:sulfite exporter TauE/SafE family protein [Thermoanaerobaculia bacterium]